jgi:hypothetical protein
VNNVINVYQHVVNDVEMLLKQVYDINYTKDKNTIRNVFVVGHAIHKSMKANNFSNYVVILNGKNLIKWNILYFSLSLVHNVIAKVNKNLLIINVWNFINVLNVKKLLKKLNHIHTMKKIPIIMTVLLAIDVV